MGEEAARKKLRWRLILTILTVVALVVFVVAARHQIIDTFENLGKVNALALLLIIPLQAVNYHAYTKLYQLILGIIDEKIDYWPMYRISLELNFVNNVFPSGGVSGFSYIGARLKSLNIPTGKATLAQFMRFILVFTSFQFLLFGGLFLLAINGRANSLMILISSSLATLLFALTVFMAYVIGSKRRIHAFSTFLPRVVNRFMRTIRPGHPSVINVERVEQIFGELHENYLVIKNNLNSLRRPLVYALLANLTEVLTIYVCYVAFGRWVNPGAVIIAYAIANFAGLVSVLPGGIGIYEGLTTATLVAAGVPAGLSLPVTVMYRVLSMGVQIPPGYYFYYKNLRRAHHPETVL